LGSLISQLQATRSNGKHPSVIVIGVGSDVETASLQQIAAATNKGQYFFAESDEAAIDAAFARAVTLMNTATLEGSQKEYPEVDFPGGEAEARDWLENEMAPVLKPHIEGPTRRALEALLDRGSADKSDIYSKVLVPLWQDCKQALINFNEAVSKLHLDIPHKDGAAAQEIRMNPVPTLKIVIENLVKMAQFDPHAVTFTKFGNRATIYNKVFKVRSRPA